MSIVIKISAFVLFICAYLDVVSQRVSCPPNLDFEFGDFTHWKCLQGSVEGILNPPDNVLHLSDTVPTDSHTIITVNNRMLDAYGEFPLACPNGSGHTIKLGDLYGGAGAAGISYIFDVPAQATEFSITYYYAVVLENPNHAAHQNPRFRARIIDMASDTALDCVSFDFVASSSLPGFEESRTRPGIVYKDWTPITVNLTEFAGKKLKLEFIVSDCTFQQHFAYAYVDVNTSCNNALATASLCEEDEHLTLNGPYGFKDYQWYMNENYTNTISDSIDYFVNPVPASAAVYNLVVTPYPGYGCVDTFNAPVKWQPKPDFDAGPDQNIQCGAVISLGSLANSGYLYSWSPADKLSNPSAANPRVSQYLFSPVTFEVSVKDKETGCTLDDAVTINPVNCFLFVPSGFTPNGDGLNDKLTPHLGGTRGLKRFSIFNRFGNRVFTTTMEGQGWDGTVRGGRSESGVYVWMIEYISADNKVMIENGTTTLIR